MRSCFCCFRPGFDEEKKANMSSTSDCGQFQRDMHLQYFNWMLQELPVAYDNEENSRLTLAYFVISALDILSSLDQVAVEETISWVYGLQVLPLKEVNPHKVEADYTEISYGFRGSPSIGIQFSPHGAHPMSHDGGHLAMTYSALAILAILGDDFSRVCREGILSSMRALQQPDGSFSPTPMEKQSDMRFLFCAVAISVILDDWTGIDEERAVDFIIKSQSYDGGFSLSPGLESHGGATYCAMAALKLITHYDQSWPRSSDVPSLINFDLMMNWCFQRQAQDGGFQGRPNKPADTCYAFWLGGSLRMFGIDQLCNQDALETFLLSSQSKWGGFSKFPNCDLPDLLHSYYGLCGFSLLGESGLESLVFELGLTHRTASRLSAFRQRNTDIKHF